ncbi:MAG: BspA family leucine-rich repeat surface protein [Bacteroidales bacterium]|nr:BspA family leucine-rich repeat surface protein [Bacteroidales bacterium]
MKKISILLILLLFLFIDAYSQKVAYAVFKGSTLTFYYDDKKPEGAYDVEKKVADIIPLSNIIVYHKEWYPKCRQIKTVIFDKSFKEYRPTSCCYWFFGCENLTSIEGIKENLNTSEVTDMSEMFGECGSLTSLDVSGFNTENVTDMDGMFEGCAHLSSLDVSEFNTENVTNLGFMFYGCTNLTSLDISSFNTVNVWYMGHVFSDCVSLKTIYVGNGWNTNKVEISNDMFRDCHNLVGGKGTKYDPSQTDASYAHIDGGESNPGYFSNKTK